MSNAYTSFQLPTGTSGHVVPFLDQENTFSEDINLGPGVQIDFTDELGDKILLFDTVYKIGIEGGSMVFYVPDTGSVQFKVNGIPVFQGTNTFSAFPAGSSASPGLVMFGDATSGLYRDGSGIGISASSINAASFSSTRTLLNNSIVVEPNVIAGNQTLALGSAYFQVYTGAGGNTWTLPALAGNTGLTFVLKNRGSGALTVASASGSQIYDTAAQPSISVAAGAAVTLINDSVYYNVI